MPEVVGDAAAFFEPNNIESLVAAIDRVSTDAGYQADLVRRGTARLQLFSWKQCAEKTLQVYRELAA